jgi:predicted GNAT family acetyltransferase
MLRDTGDRYERDEQGMTSYADYRKSGERLYIDYVYTPEPLRGSGASGRLMTALAEDVRQKGLRVTPICGYAAAWYRRNDEYQDRLA